MASRKPPTADTPEVPESENSASAAPPNSEAPTGKNAAAPNTAGNRFFGWMRELGIQRQPGWLGGVASGISFRIGVDPIIVRGIIVVVAVLGGPALLLYAAAWLLLPDTENRIHAEELSRGRFSPGLIGIGVMGLLSLLPIAQGFWYAGSVYWGDMSLPASFGRVFWTALLIAGVVFLIIWGARRAGRAAHTVVPATTDDKPDTVPTPIIPAEQLAEQAAGQAAGKATEQLAESDAPTPPPAPTPDASADELEAWKERQALWKQQHSEWKAQQSATERELRHQRALEAHERALAATAERVERRRLAKLANPRINAATAWAVLGLAIVAAGVAALVVAGNPAIGGHEATIALAAAAMTLGLAVVVAGALRHRSGVLSFFAVLAVLAMLVSAAIPRDRALLAPNISVGIGDSARYAQPAGSLQLYVTEGQPPGVTDVWQGAGTIHVDVQDGGSVRVEAVSSSGNFSVYSMTPAGPQTGEGVSGTRQLNGEWHWSAVFGSDPEPSKVIRLEQGSGTISVFDWNVPIEEEPMEEGVQP